MDYKANDLLYRGILIAQTHNNKYGKCAGKMLAEGWW